MKMLFEHKNIEYDLQKGDSLPIPAIEEIIEWGDLKDWLNLRDYMRNNPSAIDDVIIVAEHRLNSDPNDAEFYFWHMIARELKNEQ